jgi:hypothetical protein
MVDTTLEDAPEEVSLSTSKVSVLEGLKLRNEAIRLLFKRNKAERRKRDTVRKEQAQSKRKTNNDASSPEHPDESISKVIVHHGTELDCKREELRNRGIIKVPKPSRLGVAERAAMCKLIEEKRARIASSHVNRIPVDVSFQSHICRQRSLLKK